MYRSTYVLLIPLYPNMDILIIEDDKVWQQQLELMLDDLPEVRLDFAGTLEEARTKLLTRPPHLVVSDILLTDGIGFRLFTNTDRTYPVIFMTAYASHLLLDQALQISNSTFIVKPFHGLTLIAAIRAMVKPGTVTKLGAPKQLEVLGKFKQKIALAYDAILYIEADGNYMKVYTTDRVYSYKSSLKNLTATLDDRFLQIHKSFIVNTDFVKRMDLTAGIIVTHGKTLPIGRAYRRNTIARLTRIIP